MTFTAAYRQSLKGRERGEFALELDGVEPGTSFLPEERSELEVADGRRPPALPSYDVTVRDRGEGFGCDQQLAVADRCGRRAGDGLKASRSRAG